VSVRCGGSAALISSARGIAAAHPLYGPLPTRPCSCGPVAVVGNTYAAMAGQGQGCRADNSTQPWCEKSVADFCGGQGKEPNPIPPSGDTCGGQTAPVRLRAVTIGGQCNSSEPVLPPRCHSHFKRACAEIPGVGGICYNEVPVGKISAECVSATKLAEMVANGTTCEGFSSMCTLY
jgi:hypothetical protein